MTDPQRAEERAFGYCLRRLTAADRSEQDLRDRLHERGFEDGVIDAVLGRLRQAGYVDDAAFAQAWVRSRSVTKSLTAGVLRQELRRRGIAEEHIEAALGTLDSDDEDGRARDLLRRKLPPQLPADRAERDRLSRRMGALLARKGYSSGRAWSLVSQVMSERAGEASCR